ncbi:lectin-like domain-containing protein, partial [Leuconostoc pseudomesenteroides]|uniref:lectin-like domain-containing protein n=1 Tax=Leuconostoc pseudomesenteroides TaxID=33968 RepID=UPI0039EC6301
MEIKKHFKLYKAGKRWLIGGVALASFVAASSLATGNASADEATSGATPPISATSEGNSDVTAKSVTLSAPTSSAAATSSAADTTISSAAQKLDSTAATSSANSASLSSTANTLDSATSALSSAATSLQSIATTTNSVANTPNSSAVQNIDSTAAISEVDSSAGSTTISSATKTLDSGTSAPSSAVSSAQSSAATSVASSTPSAATASSSAAVTTEAKSVQVSYQDLINQAIASYAVAPQALTTVTKDNFRDYFDLEGSATYNQTTGIVTLTTDDTNLVGNFSLKSKINTNNSFKLVAQVDLGSRTSSQGGADGISFTLHNGNTTDIGNSGGNLGVGGLQDALGFKLDTYHNGYVTPQATKDGAQVSPSDSNGFGWDKDPDQWAQFGGWVTTTNQQIKAKDGNSYQRWWATTEQSTAQGLSSKNLDGKFHDFIVEYDGNSRLLTIKYTEATGNVLQWSKKIPTTSQALSLISSASTGAFKNQQRLQFISFTFQQAATVNVKYVDTKGNQIAQGEVHYPNGANVNGTYITDQLEIPNYTFVRVDNGRLPASGTLSVPGDNGTVTYVYAPAYSQVVSAVNETIDYVDQNGEKIPGIDSHTAIPVTFVTVTNPVTNTTTTYYKSGIQDQPTLDENGNPDSSWTQGNATNLPAVPNPTVDGYTVTSTTDPANDLTQATSKQITSNSGTLHYTVVYAPAYTVSSPKTVRETIHYVGQDGKTVVAPDKTGTPINFITVTNPIDKTTTTYYSKTATTATLDPKTGIPTGSDWTKGDSANFSAIANPKVEGYHVIDTGDIDNPSDLTQTVAKTVNSDSANLEYTVVYSNKQSAKVTYIDGVTGKPLSS